MRQRALRASHLRDVRREGGWTTYERCRFVGGTRKPIRRLSPATGVRSNTGTGGEAFSLTARCKVAWLHGFGGVVPQAAKVLCSKSRYLTCLMLVKGRNNLTAGNGCVPTRVGNNVEPILQPAARQPLDGSSENGIRYYEIR